MKLKTFINENGTQYREFGILKKVEITEWGLLIYNDQDICVGMKKVYYHWAGIAQKAQSLLEKPVLIETGHSSSADEYFRDIYHNFPEVLNFLDTKSLIDKTVGTQLVFARTNLEDVKYKLMVSEETRLSLKEQLENVPKKEKHEAEIATAKLDQVWESFESDPERRFVILGSAFGDGCSPTKTDKAFALRLGIDTTKRKRINVKILGRTYRNNLLVELPEYDNAKCNISLYFGINNNIKNEWCITTVTNSLRGWEKQEDILYPNWKSTRKPINWYLEAYNKMLTELINAN